MKKVLADLVWHSVLALLLISCTGEKPEGRAGIPKTDTVESAGAAIADLETAGQIRAMSPCRATMEERQPCYAVFRTVDGKRFAIGSPAATADVVQFLGTLHEGEFYAFPRVFVDYLKNRENR